MLRVTADANFLVIGSGLWAGQTLAVSATGTHAENRLTVSGPILDEVADVLARKFDWPPVDVEEARYRLQRMARTITPSVQLDVIKEDPADNRILECAISAGSGYVVTGDRDLLRLGHYDSIRIMTVSDFLKREIGLESEF